MSGRQPGSVVLLLTVPPWPSRSAPAETMLLMRPAAGLTALPCGVPITGPKGLTLRKWPEAPRYWKKWLRASCSSREVMTEGL